MRRLLSVCHDWPSVALCPRLALELAAFYAGFRCCESGCTKTIGRSTDRLTLLRGAIRLRTKLRVPSASRSCPQDAVTAGESTAFRGPAGVGGLLLWNESLTMPTLASPLCAGSIAELAKQQCCEPLFGSMHDRSQPLHNLSRALGAAQGGFLCDRF